MKKEIFYSNLDESTKIELVKEFLMFNFHQLNRTLFSGLGNERDELMNAVIARLLIIFATEMKNYFSEDQNIYDLRYSYNAFIDEFFNLYNEREKEYSQYSVEFKENKPLSGVLHWEFTKKIVVIMDRDEKDPTLLMRIMKITGLWLNYADDMKKLLFEKL